MQEIIVYMLVRVFDLETCISALLWLVANLLVTHFFGTPSSQ